MREVPESIIMATNSPETTLTMRQKDPSVTPESNISEGAQTQTQKEQPKSLYSPPTQEPNLFEDPRINDDPNDFYSRFLNMDDVSKYASDLANGLLLKPQQRKINAKEENEESDGNTVTTQHLTLTSLCNLSKMTTDDVASWTYVMNALQRITKNKEEGRDDIVGAAVKRSSLAVASNERDGTVTTRDALNDEPIPHLYNSDDESCDDDSVVLDIDAPLEEVEALEYIDAMEAAALEMEHPACYLHAVAQKDKQDCHIGILFARQTPTSPLIIHRVGNKGIFASSDLLPGMVVREINRRPMSFGVGPEDAFRELKDALPGEVSILAEGLVCTVQRLQRKQKIGLKLKETTLGTVNISKITNKSIFKDCNLQAGMTIQGINGQLCPLSAKAAKFIMKETIGDIQIVAIDGIKLEMERMSMVESGKIDQLFHKQNKISVMTQDISVAGPSSTTIPEERIVSVGGDADTVVAPIQTETSILLNGDGLSASRFEVTVTKNSVDDKAGISFSRMNGNTPLTVETIEKDGLFGQSTLVEGMVVVSINGESMTWKAPSVAADAVATSDHVTVVAEAFVTSVIKANACERVGMTLKKTTDGHNKIYIDQIPIGSKFAFTALKPGMVLLTINGRPCPKTIKETRALFADMGEGELTIMAVNVDRQWAAKTTQQKQLQHKKQHQKQRSDEVLETLNALAISSSNSTSGMIFGNDSTEEDGVAAQVEF